MAAKAAWVEGQVETPVGPVPRVATQLSAADRHGGWKVRWGMGRYSYRIAPGLYAVGSPGAKSPALVTANYKLTFDALRRELGGLDLWILVLDTRGINVWCAAGKGSFSAAEVAAGVKASRLTDIVSHRSLILPQLAAPGVRAHEVAKLTGFRVVYGPIRARDIGAFLAAGMRCTAEMRRITFPFAERIVLAPMELVNSRRWVALMAAAVFILDVLTLWSTPLPKVLAAAAGDFLPLVGGVIVGCVAVPALLPWIPVPAFTWKGWLLGIAWVLAWGGMAGLMAPVHWVPLLGALLLVPPIAAFFSYGFTGATPYTSPSGVRKELRFFIPPLVVSALAGAIVTVVAKITGRG